MAWKIWKKEDVGYIIAALAVLVLLPFDIPIERFIISLQVPIIYGFMEWISYFTSILVVLLIMTSLFLWEERKRAWIPPLWISFISSLAVGFLLKVLIARPRPEGLVMLLPLTNLVDYSFPSGHTIAAFAALPVLLREYPSMKWFWISFAVLVGLSRLYLGVHYPSDVVAGALIGYVLGSLAVFLKVRYDFPKIMDKRYKGRA